jgi:peptidoglycan/LPS O-acetylase OafA/YrhL
MMGLQLVLRPQLYFYLFLLGYYVFSRDEILEKLKKGALPLALTAIVSCVGQLIYCFGGGSFGLNGKYDYTISCNFILPAIYAYIAMLAVLGCAGRWFDQHNKFTAYMAGRSFGFYVFHYIVLVYAADITVNYLQVDIILRYAVTFLIASAGTVLLTEVIRLIPGIRTMFGINGPQRNTEKQTNEMSIK